MLLSIIIVSYNTVQLTEQAVLSVFRSIKRSQPLQNQTELLVCDNNSPDDSLRMLRRLKRNPPIPMTVIASPKNLGYAQANNHCIAKSTGKYILLLNPDTYVQQGCLEKLVFTLERLQPDDTSAYSSVQDDPYDRIGIVAASLLNPDGTTQPQGGDLPSLASLLGHYLMAYKLPIIGQFVPTTQYGGRNEPAINYESEAAHELLVKGWVAGTAMLLRREMLEEIGNLDEQIFMYGEDIELCMRAEAHHWDVTQHPTARVTHFQSASAGSANALVGEAKGYRYIWAKHKPSWQLPAVTIILRLGALIRMVAFTLVGAPPHRIRPYERIWHEAATW